MNSDPTAKPASVAAFEGMQSLDLWAVPLDGILPLMPAAPFADPPQFPDPAPLDEVLALDWSFHVIPSEGFHPHLSRRKAG